MILCFYIITQNGDEIKMMKKHIEKNKGKQQSNIDFKLMSFCLRTRDFFKNPMNKIEKTNLKSGDVIVDYGCGPGSFTFPAAEVVGHEGKVYAADRHPLAMKKIQRRAKRKGLENIETIQTECKLNLEDKSVDKILLIDVLHSLNNYEQNLEEFHRILKPKSYLFVDDHHSNGEEIIPKITEDKLFKFLKSVDSVYYFQKIDY
ncbi:MAG: methyltransferase domain-containing protein [Candidatus Lokiarchaeota archaeon]|nr:methyltransferase domain-containing protein [Candidatus Lokiarchaeota archaeon]